jgi:hypothetical protein
MDLGKIGLRGMGLIHLVQDKDWWQTVVNMVSIDDRDFLD